MDRDLSTSITEAVAEQAHLETVVASQRDGRASLQAMVDALSTGTCTGAPDRTPGHGVLPRRRMLQWVGAGLAGSAAVAALPRIGSGFLPSSGRRTPMGASLLGLELANHAALDAILPSPTIVVPAPTGTSSVDTPNILQALKKAKGGTTVVLQWSPTAVYAIDQELPIFPGVRLTGNGGSIPRAPGSLPTLQQVTGVPLQSIAASASYLAGLYGPASPGKYPLFNDLYNNGVPRSTVDGAIEIDHVVFDGQNGGTGSGNTAGHGMVLLSFCAKLHDCYFLNIANTAIVLAESNYLGTLVSNENHENRIQENTIINPGWHGLYVGNATGGATDGYILDNNITSPSQQQRTSGPQINPGTGNCYEGIRMVNAAGWWMVNNHLFACPGDGAYFNTTGGLHLLYNTIDGFGCSPQHRGRYIGFNITTAGQTKLHHGFVIGNLATAYETANPFAAGVTATPSNTYLYFRMIMQTNVGRKAQPTYQAFVNQSDNIAHQGSQPPPPIPNVTIPIANALSIAVPNGAAAGATPGIVITDSLGLIRPGTTVVSVTPGSGGTPDTIVLSAKAAKGTGDTITFVGPASYAWSYENALPAADILVHRTNETATGTITAAPRIVITPTANMPVPTVHLVDPADYVGGVFLDPAGVPQVGDIIIANSSATAAWGPAR